METKKEIIKKTITHEYAGFWRRFLAFAIDNFIIGILSSSLSLIFFSSTYRYGQDNFSFRFTPGILVAFAYFAFFWINHDGQTIGKRLMGVKLIRQDGKKIDINTAITRYIGYLISGAIFFLGFISIAFNKKRLAWHDRLAKTYVVVVGKANKALGIIVSVVVGIILLSIVSIFGLAILGAGVFLKNADKFTPAMEQFGRQMEEFGQQMEQLDQEGKLDDLKDINIHIDLDNPASPTATQQSI